VRQLKRIYLPSLEWSLGIQPRSGTLLAFLVLVIGAAVALGRTGRSFLPEFNEGTLTVSAVTLPGTSLADSDKLGRALERILLSVPEVVSTAGGPAAPNWTNTSKGSSQRNWKWRSAWATAPNPMCSPTFANASQSCPG
jgi:Cu/Ag efflux pump CusA